VAWYLVKYGVTLPYLGVLSFNFFLGGGVYSHSCGIDISSLRFVSGKEFAACLNGWLLGRAFFSLCELQCGTAFLCFIQIRTAVPFHLTTPHFYIAFKKRITIWGSYTAPTGRQIDIETWHMNLSYFQGIGSQPFTFKFRVIRNMLDIVIRFCYSDEYTRH
jgi:hypothetical protein